MRKKITAVFICCLLAMCLVLPFTACGDDVPAGEERVTLAKDGVTLRFDEVDGATEYKIYHSPSRFGKYELDSTQKETTYKNSDKYGYYRADAMQDGKVIKSQLLSYDVETFGDNMHIYSPTDDQAAIQADIDDFTNKTGQFSTERFAGLFKRGKYNSLDLRMRYYTTLAGLGEKPTDVEIGKFRVDAELSGGNATCNFWCGVENMQINDSVKWAVSQATSFRRMKVNGDMALTQTGGSSPWGSGGFISDSVITGTVDAGAQQQWFTRNSKWGNWKNGDINMVYAGCEGNFDNGNYLTWGADNARWVTWLENTTVMSEKPFLTFDDKFGYMVCLPWVMRDSKGTSWSENESYTSCEFIMLEDFYVARSDRDNAKTINAALKKGKHLFFTPGIYKIDEPLLVTEPDTVIMGNGLASLKLTEKNTDTIMRVSDVDGVKISGLIFDAGPSSKTLLEVGDKKTGKSHADDPTVLNDVYFRIGGAEQGNTKVLQTLVINSNDVIGDNFWIWRADHSYGVGWNVNETVNGAVINGDDVTIYGLMVEHFHEYQTIWNGENGFMAFYQSETPYDVADQTEWMSNWNGKEYQGYASYKVGDSVKNHTAYGIGVYYVGRNGTNFILDHGIEAPANEGIRLEHMAIANFSSPTNTGIRYIINDKGKDVISPLQNGQKTHFRSYIAGTYTEN